MKYMLIRNISMYFPRRLFRFRHGTASTKKTSHMMEETNNRTVLTSFELLTNHKINPMIPSSFLYKRNVLSEIHDSTQLRESSIQKNVCLYILLDIKRQSHHNHFCYLREKPKEKNFNAVRINQEKRRFMCRIARASQT